VCQVATVKRTVAVRRLLLMMVIHGCDCNAMAVPGSGNRPFRPALKGDISPRPSNGDFGGLPNRVSTSELSTHPRIRAILSRYLFVSSYDTTVDPHPRVCMPKCMSLLLWRARTVLPPSLQVGARGVARHPEPRTGNLKIVPVDFHHLYSSRLDTSLYGCTFSFHFPK
jgi:hypothetical protein